MYRSLEIAGLTLSPIVGVFLEKIGRKNSIMLGFLTMVISIKII